MTMAENESPKLARKASKARLHKTVSRLSIDAKFKESNNEKSSHADKDTKKTKKGKKKEKGRHEIKDERKEGELKKLSWSRGERAAAKRESFRNCVFEKVKAAMNIACKDGVTHIDIDNITPLMKCLNISMASESFIDLIRHSIIENSCEIEPLELDALVMKTQEGNVLVDVEECLEAAFNLIDFDNDGIITQPDIKQLLQHLEEDFCDCAVNNMLQTVDTDRDGQISLSEFRHFLLGQDVPVKQIPADLSEGDITAARDLSLLSNVSSITEEQQGGDNNDDKVEEDIESEMMYSPRKLDSLNRKKLFFGGFINNERHVQPVVFEWLNTEKNNSGESETRQESVEGIKEDTSTKTRSSSIAQFHEVNKLSDSNDSFIMCDRMSRDVEFIEEDIDNYKEDHHMKLNSRLSSFAQFQEVNKISDSDDAYIMCDKSSWDSESIEDIDDYMEDRVCEEGPMPLELDNETTHLPPPDLSLVDISHATDKSLSIISQQQKPRHGETDDIVSVSEVEEPEIVSEKLLAFHPRRGDPNLHDTNVQDQPVGSIFKDKHVGNAMDDVRDYNNGLISELRSQRRSSNFLQNSPISDSKDSGEKSDSITNEGKEGTESDEGIELADDEVVKRAVRIPLSPQPSSASLRIHLPRENIVCSNHPLEDKIPHTHKNRSQITIDLHDLFVNDSQNKKKNMALNGNERLNSHISRRSPKRETKHEYSGMNSAIYYSSSEEGETRNIRYQYNIRSNSSESSTTIFSTQSIESVGDSENDSLTLLNKGMKFHSWGTPEETALIKSQTNDSRNENYSSKLLDSPRITPSSQQKCEPFRTMKFNLKYDKGEAEKFNDNSVKMAHEVSHPQKSATTSKDGYHILAASERTWEEENMSDVIHNYALQGRFQSRAHAGKMNHVLYWGNSKYVHTKNHNTSKQSELAKYENYVPHENKIFAKREQAITIPDSLQRFSTRRSLQRSRTSFELPIVRDTEVSPKPSITDTTKPRKRSFSASASRRTTTTSKPQYTSISVLDLTKNLQTGVSIKNNSLGNNHYEPSNIIPLSKMLNGSHTNRHGFTSKLDYSLSRNIDKSCVPYFLHSSKITKVPPPETKTHQKMRRARNAPKRSDIHADPCNNQVGDYKDPDVIPNDVIFDNVSAFNGDDYRRRQEFSPGISSNLRDPKYHS